MNAELYLAGILLTFLCTGITANWLVQKWQYRNWLNQQRFLGSEKKYEALKTLSDEIAKISARRLSSMFRLLSALDQHKSRMEERRVIYSECLDEWNQNINSFYYKTTMYFSWSMTARLEREINLSFVNAGSRLERLVRTKNDDRPISSLEKVSLRDDLYKLQGLLGRGSCRSAYGV